MTIYLHIFEKPLMINGYIKTKAVSLRTREEFEKRHSQAEGLIRQTKTLGKDEWASLG